MADPIREQGQESAQPIPNSPRSSEAEAIDARACKRCKKTFTPKKSNQSFCGNGCRRKALALRRAIARHYDCVDTDPGLTARSLRDGLNGARQAAGLPKLRSSAALQAVANLVQAREQVKRWTAVLAKAETEAKPHEKTRCKILVLRPNHGHLALPPSIERCAIAAEDRQLAVIVLQ